jgi:hypothetical protein
MTTGKSSAHKKDSQAVTQLAAIRKLLDKFKKPKKKNPSK